MRDTSDIAGGRRVRVVRIPPRAPNGNAYAERFVRSVKEECMNRIVPLGERHLRTTLHAFAAHYHHERNHQGLGNELIEPAAAQPPSGAVRRRQRVGGILSYYYRSAAEVPSDSGVGHNGTGISGLSPATPAADPVCAHPQPVT